MSGKIFFDFGVKPIKKQKNQVGSREYQEERDGDSDEIEDKKRKQRIWKRTDYAEANEVDKMGFDGNEKQSETDHLVIRRKPRQDRATRKRSDHWGRAPGKGRKHYEKDEEKMNTSDEIDRSESEEKKRKKRRKRKKKHSNESSNIPEAVEESRYRKKIPEEHLPFRQKDPETEKVDEDYAQFDSEDESTHTAELSSKRSSKETTKTALCAPSMESMLPDDDDEGVDDRKTLEDSVHSKYTYMNLSAELRYWLVLALFILSLIIYRSFLPPLQCDVKFQQQI